MDKKLGFSGYSNNCVIGLGILKLKNMKNMNCFPENEIFKFKFLEKYLNVVALGVNENFGDQ